MSPSQRRLCKALNYSSTHLTEKTPSHQFMPRKAAKSNKGKGSGKGSKGKHAVEVVEVVDDDCVLVLFHSAFHLRMVSGDGCPSVPTNVCTCCQLKASYVFITITSPILKHSGTFISNVDVFSHERNLLLLLGKKETSMKIINKIIRKVQGTRKQKEKIC